MTASFCCPKCKEPIVAKTDGYFCQNCRIFYFLHDGYVDFIGDVEFYAGEVSQQEMQTLLDDIDSLGYNNGLTRFFKRNPFFEDYITNVTRADWICHCLGKNNLRCLDIGSGLGNISEVLSYTYQEVYSLEAVRERIEFQKRRYKNSNRSNIIIARSNALDLPLPDDYFDLVVCNGVLEWIGMMNTNLPPREAQLSFLREIRRVLSNNGCLYVGIENRFGLPFLLGGKDHSGLPYTSLLPRSVASAVVRKFGYSGGVYGDKSKKQKEKRGYYTYTYSILGYSSLLKQAGFKFKSYWVFPSYNEPYFSGNLDDKIGLKGFIHYFKNTVTRFKIALSILEKLDKSILGLIVSLFTPSFLFYCYKNEKGESFEDIITNNTLLKNYTALSEGSGIMYILYDIKGKPIKVIHLKRDACFHLPSNIPFYDKTNPNLRNRSERAWIEDWIPGKKLNPLKFDESEMAIKWLINFQNKTRSVTMTKNDIYLEVNAVRTGLLQIPHLNSSQYKRWLDEYESYVATLNVNKTAEHGDFWYGNILIDSTLEKINVIDWENYREKGDPLFDFVFFIISAMLLPNGTIEEFQSNLNGSGRFSPIMRKLQYKINNYFGFKLSLDTLIRYAMLRFIVRKQLEKGMHDKTVTQFNRILSALSSKV